MYSNILVPMALDHGLSGGLLETAQNLMAPDGRITALHVFEAPFGLASATLTETFKAEGLLRAQALIQEKVGDLPFITPKIVEGHVHRTIVDFAAEHQVDCIIMGSHKPGLSDYLLGSTAARVVRHAQCSVHVYRGG